MRNTIYRQMIFCIDTYRTWIEVADDNLYKDTSFRGTTGPISWFPARWYCVLANRMAHTTGA